MSGLNDEQMGRLEALGAKDELTEAEMAELEDLDSLASAPDDVDPNVAPSVQGFTVEDVSADVVRQKDQAQLSTINNAFRASQETTEDDASTTAAISKQLGVSFDTVRANLPAFKKSAAAANFDADRWRKENPKLAKVLLEHPEMGEMVMSSKELGPLVRAWNDATDWVKDTLRSSLGPESDSARASKGLRDSMESGNAEDFTSVTGDLKAEDTQRTNERAKRDAPQQVLEKDDALAKIARNKTGLDYANMVAWQRGIETWKSLDIARKYAALMLAENGGPGDVADLQKEIADAELDSTPRAYGDNSGIVRDLSIGVQGGVSTLQVVGSSVKGAGAAGVVGGIGGGVAGGLATRTPQGVMAGAATGARFLAPKGAKIGAAWATFNLEAGSQYKQSRELVTDQGQKLTPAEAAGGAIAVGLINSGLEMVSFGQQTKVLKGALPSQITGLIKKDPTFRRLLSDLSREWFKSIATEGITEGMQNAVGQVAEYAQAALKDQAHQKRKVIDPQQVLQDVEAGSLGAMLLGGGSTMTSLALTKTADDKSQLDDRQVTPLLQLAQEPTVQAAPEVFAKMVEEESAANGGKPLRSLHVDAHAIVVYFQNEGKTGEQANAEVAELVGPEAPAQLLEAAATGGKLEVPMSKVMGPWGASEIGQALADDTTTDPLAPTLRQRAEQKAEIDARTQALVDEEVARFEDEQHTDRLVDQYVQSIIESGRDSKEARAAGAAMMRTFLETAARDENKRVSELFPEVPILFRPGDEKGTEGQPVPEDLLDEEDPSTVADAPSEPTIEAFASGLTEEQRAEMMFRDDVTGLPTRRAWDATPRTPGTMVGVVTVPDVKGINDSPKGGHEITNKLLRQVGVALDQLVPDRMVVRSGTDFLVEAQGQAELDAIVANVQAGAPKGVRVLGFTGQDVASAYAAEKAGTSELRKLPEGDQRRVLERGKTAFDVDSLTDESFPGEPSKRPAPQLKPLAGEEFVNEVLRDRQMPGVLSRHGYLNSPARPFAASIDMRGLKKINEWAKELSKGNELGDAVLAAFGKAAMRAGGSRVFFAHMSGDEFAAKGHSQEELDLFVRRFEAELQRVGVPVTLRDGTKLELVPTFRHGIAEGTYGKADQQLNIDKAREPAVEPLDAAGELRRAGVLRGEPRVDRPAGAAPAERGVTGSGESAAGVLRETPQAQPAEGGSVERGNEQVPEWVTEADLGPLDVAQSDVTEEDALVEKLAAHHELRQEEEEAIRAGFNRPESIALAREAIARFRAAIPEGEKKESAERAERRKKAALKKRDERRTAALAFLKWIEGTGPRVSQKGDVFGGKDSVKLEPELYKKTVAWARKLNLIDPSNGLTTFWASQPKGLDPSMRRGKYTPSLTPRDRAIKDEQRQAFAKNVLGRLQQDDPRAPLKQAPPRWFSMVERAVLQAKQTKNTPAAWWSVISKAPGVKAEELKLIGLKEWLDKQKGSLERAQVKQFIEENKVEVTEKIIDGQPDLSAQESLATFDDVAERLRGAADRIRNELHEYISRNPEVAEKEKGEGPLNNALDHLGRAIRNLEFMPDKALELSQEQARWEDLDGDMRFVDDDLREALALLSSQGLDFAADAEQLVDALVADLFSSGQRIKVGVHRPMYGDLTLGRESLDVNYREVLFYTPTAAEFRAAHFGGLGSGLLAHARLTDRKLEGGAPVLFVEEVQSDLHQAGRKRGYRDPEARKVWERWVKESGFDIKKPSSGRFYFVQKNGEWSAEPGFATHEEVVAAAKASGNARQDFDPSQWSKSDLARARAPVEVERARAQLEAEKEMDPRDAPPPRAAFADSWEELVAKRMLSMAIERGDSTVGWTTGAQQLDRYDGVGEALRDLIFVPAPTEFSSGEIGFLKFTTRGGVEGSQEIKTEAEIASLVGETIGRRLLANPNTPLTGNHLFLGGEGMRNAYDVRLPSVFRSILKSTGGTVQQQQLETGEKIWTATIPESLAKQVQGEGMRLFQDDPNLTPNEQLKQRIEAPIREFLLSEGIEVTGADDRSIAAWLEKGDNAFIAARQSDGKWVAVGIGGLPYEDIRFSTREGALKEAKSLKARQTVKSLERVRANWSAENFHDDMGVPRELFGKHRFIPEQVSFWPSIKPGVALIEMTRGDESRMIQLEEVLKLLPALPKGLARDAEQYTQLLTDEKSFENRMEDWRGRSTTYNAIDVGVGQLFDEGGEIRRVTARRVRGREVTLSTTSLDGGDARASTLRANEELEAFDTEPPTPVKQRELGEPWFQNEEDSAAGAAPAPKKKGPKGYVIAGVRALQSTINAFLNRHADFSTVVHESAHGFLEQLLDLGERPEASERSRQKAAAVLAALGVSQRSEITREHHEKFARQYEAWLTEGKMPTKQLARLFRNLTNWMLRIYKAIRSIPEHDKEALERLRPVFEAMHATEQAIAAARRAEGPKQTQQTEQQLEDEIDEYAEASYDAQLRAVKDALRIHEAWWKKGVAKLQKAIANEYDGLPATRALNLLRGDQGVVLNSADVTAVLGEQKLKGVRVDENGASPGMVAELSGFPSGEAMLRAIVDHPKKEKWVELEANREMERLNPGVYQRTAEFQRLIQGGLHKATQKRIEREWSGLPRDALQRAARGMAAARPVQSLNPRQALVQQRRAANDKARAAAAGDITGAGDAARVELLNHFLHGELMKAQDEVEAGLEVASRLGKVSARERLGKASPAYRDAAEFLRGALFGGPQGDMSAITQAIAQLNGDGVLIGDPDWLKPLQGAIARVDSYEDMTVSEFRSVIDALKMLNAGAIARTKMLVEGKSLDFEEVKAAVLAEIESTLPSRGAVKEKYQQTSLEKLGGLVNSVDGHLLSPVDLVRDLTGDDPNSMLHKVFVNTLRRAQSLETDLLEQRIKPIIEKLEEMPKAMRKRLGDPIDGASLFPGHRKDLSPPRKRFELLMMALNSGNEGNQQVLLEGRNITREELTNALNALTKEEIDWVNAVLESLEQLREPAFALEERVTGLKPTAVEAVPMQLTNGLLRGGYFPLKAVPELSRAGAMQFGDDQLASVLDPTFSRPTTRHGHLKSRTGATYAVSLDPDVIRKHLLQVAHDIAFREAVRDAAKLVMDQDVRGKLIEHLGAGKAEQFLKVLKDIGGAKGYQANDGETVMRFFKGNLATSALSGLSTALGNIATLPTAVATGVSAKHLAAATLTLSPSMRREALAKSGIMRTNASRLVQELKEATGDWTRHPVLKGHDHLREAGMAAMRAIDTITGTAVWTAAYRQAKAAKKEEGEAVRFADDMLLRVLPSMSTLERAGILRDPGWLGALAMFYSYLSVAYRQQHRIAAPLFTRAFQQKSLAQKAVAAGKVAGGMLAFYIAFQVLGELGMGRGPEAGDEDEDDPENKLKKWRNWFVRKVVGAPLNTVPIVPLGSMFDSAVLKKRAPSPRSDPTSAALASIYESGRELITGDDPKKSRTAAMRAIGNITGAPTRLVDTTGGYLFDVATGEVVPRNPADFVSGVLYGRRENQPGNIFTLAEDLWTWLVEE